MSYIFVLVVVIYVIRLLISLSNRQSPHTPPGFEEVANRPARSAEDDAGLVRKDLGRLDAVHPGLGQEAVRYVLKGDNDSVMLKLSQHQTAVAQALRQNSWSTYGSWMSGRADFLLAASEWRPKAVRRYGEVLDFIHVGASWIRLPASDKAPRWFRALLYEYGQARAAALNKHTTWKVAPPAKAKRPWSIDQLIDLLGDDLAPILDAAFTHDEGYSRSYTEPGSPEQMSGFEAHLRSDPDRRIAELRPLGAKARSGALRKFAQMKLVDGAYFDFAFSQASDSAKSVREGAALLLRAARPDLLLQRTADAWPTLKAGQKGELASVTLAVCGNAGVELLSRLAETEKTESVRADIKRRLGEDILVATSEDGVADSADGYTAVDGSWVATPPAAPLPEDTPVSPALRELIVQAFTLWREEAERHNQANKDNKPFYRQFVPPMALADQLIEVMNGKRSASRERDSGLAIINDWGLNKTRASVRDQILYHPDLTLWHLARLQSDAVGYRNHGDRAHAVFFATSVGRAMRSRLNGDRDLRTYMDICVALGSKADGAARHLLTSSYWRPDLDDWGDAALWPYVNRHLDMIDQALGLTVGGEKLELSELSALDTLKQFPLTPARYTKTLLDRAVGDRKTVRQPARDLLGKTPGLPDVLVPLLKHPKSDMRAGAAEWLGDLKAASALDALLDAARKEQIPAAKASMLGAISRLGGEIGEFVSAKALLGEAQTGLKKTPGKGLEWFPFDGLPVVHQKNGTPLDPQVVRWWITLASRLKQPGGNPWFDLLLDELATADAAKLGLAIMQAFVAYDTSAPSEAEANAYAAANVDATLAQYQRWDSTMTRERIFSMLRGQRLTAYFGSANDQKGILALCVRAPAVDAVNITRAYFRDHYTRTAQCKALIECLAGNPSPLAVQYVLTIAKRWRTKGVQELAGQLVEAIAEKRGWTAEELADRTIPTGGFNEAGILELPVGDRSYQARLDGEGRLSLFNPDGKPVQGLPASAAGPAADSLKESKALLSTARKEVKQVWDFQSRRLYEALCVERDWSREDWSEHLLEHPVVGRLVQRLVWIGLDGRGGKLAVFRPMEDLTLTDASDNPVDLASFARVRLAHGTALTADEAAAWKAHLTDYEVTPLFDQLGRPTMTSADGRETEIIDRKGWMIEAFKLRGAATRLGYNRGAAEDGGVFMTYEKPFDALKLVAVVEFTGNGLPEENRPSALVALRFVRQKKAGGFLNWSSGVPMKDVPAVLLSEAWNDFHAMAAAGSGFDAEWEKKAGW